MKENPRILLLDDYYSTISPLVAKPIKMQDLH